MLKNFQKKIVWFFFLLFFSLPLGLAQSQFVITQGEYLEISKIPANDIDVYSEGANPCVIVSVEMTHPFPYFYMAHVHQGNSIHQMSDYLNEKLGNLIESNIKISLISENILSTHFRDVEMLLRGTLNNLDDQSFQVIQSQKALFKIRPRKIGDIGKIKTNGHFFYNDMGKKLLKSAILRAIKYDPNLLLAERGKCQKQNLVQHRFED